MMFNSLRHSISRHSKLLLVVLLLLNIGVISSLAYFLTRSSSAEIAQKPTKNPEITAILQTTNARLQSNLYRQLINRVGPVEAQEDLFHSGLPFDGQTHLLNHTVGDWLYTKYGTKGLTYCKDYFLSSCYHGFLIKFIAEKGLNNIDSVMQACWNVGYATASQCAHAIGHGLLAWDDYKNLPQALSDCDKVAGLSPKFPSYNCYDGVFMENNWAVHDDGTPSPDRWVEASDPTYPCYDGQIAEKYRQACWSNQPQVMYKLFNGDLAKIATQCENIAAKEYQDTCFDSIARQINPLAQGNPRKVFDLCNLMPVGWKNACVISNVSAFFSVGDRQTPFLLCQAIPDSGTKACYNAIEQRIVSYATTISERVSLCGQVPSNERTSICKGYLTNSSGMPSDGLGTGSRQSLSN
ncbi:hypothetical protein BH09PAT1_BH09PAT1_5150 [soil metagenome]